MALPQDLSGTVQPGRGLGAGLMADHAVMERLRELAGFRDRAWHPERALAATARSRLELALCGRDRDQPGLGEARSGQAGYFLAPSSLPSGIGASPFRRMSP